MKLNISCHTVRQTMLSSPLQLLLEMSAFCPYTRSNTFTPLVNDSLVHDVPNVQQTLLQFVNAVGAATNALVAGCRPISFNRSEGWCYSAATDLEEWKWVLTAQKIAVSRAQYTGAPSCWKIKKLPDASRITAAVIGACHCNSCCWSLPICRSTKCPIWCTTCCKYELFYFPQVV